MNPFSLGQFKKISDSPGSWGCYQSRQKFVRQSHRKAQYASKSLLGFPVVLFTALLCFSQLGCQNLNHTENGALMGSGLGALSGAIIGHQTGNRDEGALVGAAVGGLTGGVLGKSKDRQEERDAALAHAHHTEMMHRAERRAITNYDVIKMVSSGVSDQAVIGTIQDKWGRFDLSPQGIITLSKSGVSPEVVEAMRRHNLTP